MSIENEDEEIHDLVNINEIQDDSSPFIAAVEECHTNLAAKNAWSSYPFKPVCQDQFEQSVEELIRARDC